MPAHPFRGDAGAMDTSVKPRRYEIRIRGVLSETLLGGFPGLDARAEDGHTVLTGPLPDQAALHGVLNQVEGLGLELVALCRIPFEE
jgi:hypothetical protein